MMLSAAQAELGRVFVKALSVLPLPFLRDTPNIVARVRGYGTESIKRHKRMLLSGELTEKSTFFSKILENDNNGKAVLSDSDVEIEASNFIVAGSDTTAVTLTYLIWAVLQHPEVRAKIEEEVLELKQGAALEELEKMKWLNAAIEETLRLYGAAPGALPRVVPPQGALFQGYHLAKGTIVVTQSYTLHRDETIFQSPMEWRPERWLNPTAQMREAFMPFGAGSRICLGIHLARAELLYSAVEFFRRMPGMAKVSSQTTKEDMEFENYFLVAPRAHKCLITVRET